MRSSKVVYLYLPREVELALKEVVRCLSDICRVRYLSDRLYKSTLHYIANRGKLIRPVLLLLTCHMLNGDLDKAIRAAVAVECVHIASLLQDDVFDMHRERRGVSTPRELFGDFFSILASNVFIAKAVEYSILTGVDKVPIEIARAAIDLADGEALELELRESSRIDPQHYFSIIRKKTASLIEAAMVIGAYLSKASERDVKKVRMLGRLLGILYQVRDDIIDFLDGENEKVNIVNVFMSSGLDRDSALDKALKILRNLFKSVDKAIDSVFGEKGQILKSLVHSNLRLHIADLF
ncbi:MAG: polyprenyl synthetase family protein [Crenarchaeota archaeon]|nr:polyprenyl synthetase family protein [Thermoproteota archaeon]